MKIKLKSNYKKELKNKIKLKIGLKEETRTRHWIKTKIEPTKRLASLNRVVKASAGNPILNRPPLLLPVAAIVLGELLIFYSRVIFGLTVHILNLQSVSLLVIFGKLADREKRLLQSLALLILLRLVNLSLPQFFTLTLLWYPLIYGVMFLPIYLLINSQNITMEELGANTKKLWLYTPIALAFGSFYALLEYSILHPQPLITAPTLSNLALITLVMTFFVSLVEELSFRSILLTRIEDVAGTPTAILVSSLLFAVMHSGYTIHLELFYALLAGLFLGYSFHRSRSLPMVIIFHATTNILLFGFLPFKI